jgi:hypothetical protein
MKRFLLFLLVFISLNSYAKNRTTDSLRQLFKTELADTMRVILLYNLVYQYWYSSPDTSLVLTQQYLTLARKVGFEKGKANALYSLGTIFQIKGNYTKSLEYCLQDRLCK